MKFQDLPDPSQFKLVVFDVDGTLLDSAHTLRPFTSQTLLALKKRGVALSLATGKMINTLSTLIRELELSVPLVLANGALLQHPNGEVVFEKPMQPEIVRTILNLAEEHGITCVIQRVGGTITLKENEHIRSLLQYGGKFQYCGQWQDAPGGLRDVVKVLSVHVNSRERLRNLETIVKGHLGNRVDSLATVPQILEYMTPGVHKAYGVRHLADWLGIGMQQVIAFGDDNNDVEMLRAARLGIAPGNGIPAAKENANLIVDAHDEEGPARFLADFFKLA